MESVRRSEHSPPTEICIDTWSSVKWLLVVMISNSYTRIRLLAISCTMHLVLLLFGWPFRSPFIFPLVFLFAVTIINYILYWHRWPVLMIVLLLRQPSNMFAYYVNHCTCYCVWKINMTDGLQDLFGKSEKYKYVTLQALYSTKKTESNHNVAIESLICGITCRRAQQILLVFVGLTSHLATIIFCCTVYTEF